MTSRLSGVSRPFLRVVPVYERNWDDRMSLKTDLLVEHLWYNWIIMVEHPTATLPRNAKADTIFV